MRLVENMIRENPALLQELLQENGILTTTRRMFWPLMVLPYAAVTFSVLMVVLFELGNFGGALAALGPVLAATVGTIGLLRKRGF